MICKKPYVNAAGQTFGCGQCLPCRINSRRVWTTRILCETLKHSHNTFATLTYADDNQKTLDPEDLRLFLDRLRHIYKYKYGDRLRYFAVGEYGDDTQRPHYHVALFNFRGCRWGQSWYSKTRLTCCQQCELVRDTWGKGNIFLGTLEADSAQYVAGYVTKKMTAKDDPRLSGRYPEFMRCSRRPGVGADAAKDIARTFLAKRPDDPDVPNALRFDGKHRPLGRFMVQKIRKEVGRDEKAPQSVLDKQAAEMFDVRMAARSSTENPSLSYHLNERDIGKIRKAEFMYKLKNSRRKL